MATATSKDINDAIRGALLDETDGTVSKQVTIVSIQTGTPLSSTKKDLNSAVRGALIDEADQTLSNQTVFLS